MIEIDVLCVGHASYDLVFKIDKHPLPDDKSTAADFVRCGGGPAANAAVVVSRLGLASAYAGYLGDDVFGELHLAELVSDGVNVEYVVRGDRQTPISAILVKQDGKRSVVNYRADVEPLKGKSILFNDLVPKVILFDGHEPDISLELVEQYKKYDVPMVLDAGSVHPGTESLMSKTDYLIGSYKFGKEFIGSIDTETILDGLSSFAPVIILTLGGKGLVWKTVIGRGYLPAYEVDVLDTTGAGDAFHGAFAACIADGKDLDAALHIASAAGALCCTQLGARPALTTKDELNGFLQEHNAPYRF
jgi:sulfofructose kinase